MALSGISAAWRAPAAISRELRSLMLPIDVGVGVVDPAAGALERSAVRGIVWLSRLPGNRWRNTCLYRSVAVCIALRDAGYRATLVIGIRTDGGVRAHAWVVSPALESIDPRAIDFVPLGATLPDGFDLLSIP